MSAGTSSSPRRWDAEDTGDAWSFSAFTVLVYYALTNLAALRLPAESRRYPPVVSVLGLIAAGLAWHAIARKLARV